MLDFWTSPSNVESAVDNIVDVADVVVVSIIVVVIAVNTNADVGVVVDKRGLSISSVLVSITPLLLLPLLPETSLKLS